MAASGKPSVLVMHFTPPIYSWDAFYMLVESIHYTMLVSRNEGLELDFVL